MQQLKILVCGAPGVGKSALINSLIGFKVCEEVSTEDLETAEVKKIEVPCGRDLLTTFYESPGLEGGFRGNAGKHLDKMHSECRDVDVLLYCVDTTNSTTHDFTKADSSEIIHHISNTFGQIFWKYCLLVLTKANMVEIPIGLEEQTYCKKRYDGILKSFRDCLVRDIGTDGGDIAKSIKACTAGRYYDYEGVGDRQERYVYSFSGSEKVDFLKEILKTCNSVGSISQSDFAKFLKQRILLSSKYEEVLEYRKLREQCTHFNVDLGLPERDQQEVNSNDKPSGDAEKAKVIESNTRSTAITGAASSICAAAGIVLLCPFGMVPVIAGATVGGIIGGFIYLKATQGTSVPM